MDPNAGEILKRIQARKRRALLALLRSSAQDLTDTEWNAQAAVAAAILDGLIIQHAANPETPRTAVITRILAALKMSGWPDTKAD